MSEIRLFKLTNRAYNHYCNATRGNSETSYELAQRKLTRNILLSMKLDIGKKKIVYIYGQLHIFTKGNTITWIENIPCQHDWFYKDMNEYERLNEVLGINELENKQLEVVKV